ncbi:hypothetical protein [Saccharibacillus sacchari]|uniref:Uncharacterized protein n=1 Tax=Saccharibacillus sacchari TaxID=456493 RepID=A0ACC6PHU1_9BACL
MKKFLGKFGMVLVLLTTFTVPSFAKAADQSIYSAMSLDQLAYSDVEHAPKEWKEKILAAREKLIYSESWTVDGQVSYELPDGTLKSLPEFSELFPGWDVPKVNTFKASDHPVALDDPIFTIMAASYVGYVYLFNPPVGQETPNFYAFTANTNRVTMEASTLPGSSYNAGYANLTNGTSVGWANNLALGSKFHLTNPVSGHSYAARASTYSTEGYALMSVYNNPI